MTSEQKSFIENIASAAKKYAAQYGIKVISPIIAQAIIESNWGKSSLASKYHNYFGLKCGSSWKGKSVNMNTKEEYIPGTLTNISANFRVYDNLEAGVKGYFDFISMTRYSNLKGITDPKKYIETIKADGYATDSKYVTTIYGCVTTYGLTIYDTGVGGNATKKKTFDEVVNGVIAGIYGDGETRRQGVEAEGYSYSEVQSMVNAIVNKSSIPKKSTDEIAKAVIAGEYGDGAARKQKLESEGYDYDVVQTKVNELTRKNTSAPKKTAAEIAREIIKYNNWGTGSERKRRVEQAGCNYDDVQREVNKLLRK
mgnify:CR=1 FL=1